MKGSGKSSVGLNPGSNLHPALQFLLLQSADNRAPLKSFTRVNKLWTLSEFIDIEHFGSESLLL